MPANTLAQQANPRHGNDRLSVIVYSVSNIVDNKVIVRARCYRSMRKNEEPHKLEVIHGLPVGFYSRLLPGESLLFQTLTAYEGGRENCSTETEWEQHPVSAASFPLCSPQQ